VAPTSRQIVPLKATAHKPSPTCNSTTSSVLAVKLAHPLTFTVSQILPVRILSRLTRQCRDEANSGPIRFNNISISGAKPEAADNACGSGLTTLTAC
jgi:hypothetical protein